MDVETIDIDQRAEGNPTHDESMVSSQHQSVFVDETEDLDSRMSVVESILMGSTEHV